MNASWLFSLLGSDWRASPSVIVAALAAAVTYVLGVRRAGRWPVHRTALFLGGIGCVVIALQSGIDAYDDRLLSVHMVQHMLLLLIAPPLLLGGRPLILALRALPPRRRRSLAKAVHSARVCTAPVPVLVVFIAVILLTHLPAFYDATLRDAALHDSEHAIYLLAGLLMWSPLLDSDPAPKHQLGGFGKLAYLIVAMLPMALVGAYLNRHATLVYPPYAPPAHALGVSALDDQAQAGAIMWVVGNTVMVAVGLCAAVAAMVTQERRQVERESRASLAAGEEGHPA